MKPVLILQHLHADGPAYLAKWLHGRRQPFRIFNAESGENFRESIDGYCALAVLGGEMSANDRMPSLRAAERLILQAMDSGIPVLGHCLGGQLMARALGAHVVASRSPEIGWLAMQVADDEEARAWFGPAPQPTVFQWHYEAFTLPPGARSLAGSEACAHQAFAIGPHLAMQFHVELDEPKLRQWVSTHDERFLAYAHLSTVQDRHDMLAGMDRHLPAQLALARRIYARWQGFAGA